MSPKCNCISQKLIVSGTRPNIVRVGYFFRSSDRKRLQRYRLKCCGKTFSDATDSECFGQKKRHLNESIMRELCSGVSERKTAHIINVNRKTVVRKFRLFGAKAQELLPILNAKFEKSKIVVFDDLESFEHTKCKPLSVILMVEHGTRRILGFRLAQMPCKGRLAAISRKKYGHREDKRREARHELFNEVKDFIEPDAVIKSDQSPHYPNDVKHFFPNAKHEAYKGRKAAVIGQGELKSGGFDPLFSVNHTFAMFRDNIKRLYRRNWCTTKRSMYLTYMISMYALYHNFILLK